MCLCSVVAWFPAVALGAPKTDIVTLKNGDHFTVEIRQLERGKLTVKTDDVGTLGVEWNKVQRLQSTYQFETELDTGEQYFGSLAPSDAQVCVVTRGGPICVDSRRVIRIDRIGNTFWQRLDGSLSVGLDLAKSNHSSRLDLHADTSFRSTTRSLRLTADSTLSRQDDADDIRRNSMELEYQKYFTGKAGFFTSFTIESNEELGLNFRGLAAAGGLVQLVHESNRHAFLTVGLAYSRDLYEGTDPDRSNLELVFGTQLARYRFDAPQIDTTLSVVFFPSLSDLGRIRWQIDLSARRELLKDLFVSLNGYLTADNEPPEGVESTSDWGVGTSLGWSF
jgi:hypothetical protein